MTRSWRPGLRVQVLLAGVAAVLVVVLASAAATAWYFMDSQYKAHHSRALAVADGLAVQLERILALDIPLHDLEGFDAQCDEALARHGGLSYALVADLQGQLLFRSDRAAVAGPGMPSKVDLNEPHQHAFSADESEHPVSSPVRGADGLAVATVVVAFPLAALQADRNGLLLRVAGVGTLALLVVLALLWMGLSRVLVGPLDRVVEAVARLRAGDRQARVQLPAGPAGELALLADGFNGLAQTVVLREQELLSARDAAEQANRAKSQFLAVMSHELRTPLNAVLGMAEVLARSPLDARQQRLLGQIRTSGRLLADIIADLLDLSTIEAGRLRVAVLLPGAYYFLRETRLPPVQGLRDAGVPIAIATDHNPGSSPVLSLLLMINMACTLFRMTPEEAWRGVTVHAARALGLPDRGVLRAGARADFVVWNAEHPREMAYRFGHNPCRRVVFGGLERTP